MKEKGNTVDLHRSLIRSADLRNYIQSYIEASKTITTGLNTDEHTTPMKNRILDIIGGTQSDWNDWKWQVKNRIDNSGLLAEILGLSEIERKKIDRTGKIYRWAISPYYLSLIGITKDKQNSPIFKQAVPDIRELSTEGSLDPMNEAQTSPAPCVTRRYPDRLIINVTNQCSVFCRHCQRRRNIGEMDAHSCHQDIKSALDYVARSPEIRDVLITGGDALLLSDGTLNWILKQLDQIPHVEIKRIGTRTPVTLPQRITPALCNVIRSYPPVFINTQFNHPLEITAEAKQACDKLIEAGAILGNQTVLLRGINDQTHIMKKLCHELLKIRIHPYYIFHAKDVKGTLHFQTSIAEGIEIMESLRGYTSGLAVPTYIINAPGGLGKIPLMPNYIINMQENSVTLKTWEGKTVTVPNVRRN